MAQVQYPIIPNQFPQCGQAPVEFALIVSGRLLISVTVHTNVLYI